jgi:aminopeptidase C
VKKHTYQSFLLVVMMSVLMTGCRKKAQTPAKETFVIETQCHITPVKDQGRSSLCWIYAMLATIESEHIAIGDSVNLSPDYVGRMLMEEEAKDYYFSQGTQPFSSRGMGQMLIRLMMEYGVEPYDAYQGNANLNYNVLMRKIAVITDNGMARRDGLAPTQSAVSAMLDNAIGPLPKNVYMYGAEYTPVEFAHSVCMPDEYISLTSFTHHPFYKPFVLEVPDNRYHDEFMNLPIDSLVKCVENRLRSGHAVCWEGDVSERGFSFASGIARLMHEGRIATQEERQHSFEDFHTTDDHCMELIGIAHDAAGHRFFLCKNSWGKGNPYGGLMFMSENYLRMKTVAVYMKR